MRLVFGNLLEEGISVYVHEYTCIHESGGGLMTQQLSLECCCDGEQRNRVDDENDKVG